MLAVRQVLVLVLVAAFLAVGLDPAVAFLQRRRMRRASSVVAGVASLVLLFAIGAPYPVALACWSRSPT